MSFLTSAVAAILAAAPLPDDCALRIGTPSEQRSFTNADLARMAECRRATGDSDESQASARPSPMPRPASRLAPRPTADTLEADWRARWRSVDQRVRKLRFEARELRIEAAAVPKDPKRRPTGRRTPALLMARADQLEAEAREIENEFADSARRLGALPGWLRPAGR